MPHANRSCNASGGSPSSINSLDEAFDIKDADQIVGYNSSGGALLTSPGATPTTFSAGTATSANGINGAGQIVGSYRDGNQDTHGFFYRNAYPGGTPDIVTFDVPGSSQTVPLGINNNGQIVGTYEDPARDWSWHGFFYDPVYGFVPLSEASGYGNGSGSEISGTNDKAWIVGSYTPCVEWDCGYDKSYWGYPPFFHNTSSPFQY